MDLFDKATQVAKNVGCTLYNSTKEQSEIASLNVQLTVVQKKLEANYTEIGKRYVEYVTKCEESVPFQVDDILEQMKPELEKLEELQAGINEKKENMRRYNVERMQKKAEEEFQETQRRLDRALEMDIITESEYHEKYAMAKRKYDSFELLNKIDMQFEMGIITKEEYKAKRDAVLNN